MLKETSIYLIGMPGCGKSTLGKQYADYSGYSFVDTDEVIIQEQGKSIERIYEEVQEIGFRTLEHELILRLAEKKKSVICTGGGLPCFFDNIDIMNRQGVTVFMDVPADELWRRIKDTNFSGRPIYQNKTPEQIQEVISVRSAERRVFYSKASIVLTGNAIKLDQLISALKELKK